MNAAELALCAACDEVREQARGLDANHVANRAHAAAEVVRIGHRTLRDLALLEAWEIELAARLAPSFWTGGRP